MQKNEEKSMGSMERVVMRREGKERERKMRNDFETSFIH